MAKRMTKAVIQRNRASGDDSVSLLADFEAIWIMALRQISKKNSYTKRRLKLDANAKHLRLPLRLVRRSTRASKLMTRIKTSEIAITKIRLREKACL